jgi:hypothetical protein
LVAVSRPTGDAAARPPLRRRVEDAAQALLAGQQSVAPLDVLLALRWIQPVNVQTWQRGKVEGLAEQSSVGLDRMAEMITILTEWAQAAGLQRSEISYVSNTRSRTPLRLASYDEPLLEVAFRTQWTPPQLTEAARERAAARARAAPDLVVVWPLRAWTCGECGEQCGPGTLLTMEDDRPLCLSCADLDRLVYLPAGDAALTRRARKASTLSAVVVRFSRPRKRHERQGILVEQAALEAAEQQCLGDVEARARRRERDRERRIEEDSAGVLRMAAEIVRLLPGCSAARATAIAEHASVRGSGRVGRSAAGRELDEGAVLAAVVASVRHEDTAYDELLMAGVPRQDARARVLADIDRVLESWR